MRRSIARTLRQPIVVVPNLVFPLFLLFVISSGGQEVTRIRGFPTDSYITFLFGATVVQAAAGGMIVAASGLGSDIETGFLSRLALTPLSTSTLITAQLAGVAVFGAIQGGLSLAVALAAGVSVKAGVAGGFALIALALLIVVAFGALGLLVAAKTGSTSQVQGFFAIALGLLFMSSMIMPRNLISAHWFKIIATYNPMSYLVEATRSLLITGWNGEALALGCGVAVLTLVLALSATIATLKRSVLRT